MRTNLDWWNLNLFQWNSNNLNLNQTNNDNSVEQLYILDIIKLGYSRLIDFNQLNHQIGQNEGTSISGQLEVYYIPNLYIISPECISAHARIEKKTAREIS